MKLLVATALASTALLTFISSAGANGINGINHYETVCSTTQSNYDPPSGVYVAPDGTKWAGYKHNGSVPESLVGGSNTTTCTEVLVPNPA